MKEIKKVAIIGTGVIGAGWIIRCLAHNKIVYAYDKDLRLIKNKAENKTEPEERKIVKIVNFDDENNNKNNDKIKVKTF